MPRFLCCGKKPDVHRDRSRSPSPVPRPMPAAARPAATIHPEGLAMAGVGNSRTVVSPPVRSDARAFAVPVSHRSRSPSPAAIRSSPPVLSAGGAAGAEYSPVTAAAIASASVKEYLTRRDTRSLSSLLNTLKKEHTPYFCQEVMQLLEEEQLVQLFKSDASDSYWKILANGELLFNWCSDSTNSTRYLMNQVPRRFLPDRVEKLDPLQRSIATQHLLYERERDKLLIYKILDKTIEAYGKKFPLKRRRINHFVFRGSDEDFREVFTEGFRLGSKDDHKLVDKLIIRSGPSSGFITQDFTSGASRAVISTSYSVGKAGLFANGFYVYICVPHLGFNLSSGAYLELAEFGIPNQLVLCALKYPYDSIGRQANTRAKPEKIYLNNNFYDEDFICEMIDCTPDDWDLQLWSTR